VKFLLIILFLFSRVSFAKCEDQTTTIDSQYEQLKRSVPEDSNEFAIGVTKLLNAAFTPYLISLHDLIRQIPKQEIKNTAKEVSGNIQHSLQTAHPYPAEGEFELDVKFGWEYWSTFDDSDSMVLRGAHTAFSKNTMYKLHLALLTMGTLERLNSSPQLEPSISRSHNLRQERTYTKTDIWFQMFFAYLSVMQSAAALLADQVEGWTSEQMLKEIMSPGDDCLGLVVHHSLLLPPRLLGEKGSDFYRRRPLVEENHRLVFSPDFWNFLKHKRMKFALEEKKRYEFMKGCPVAHKMEGLDFRGAAKVLGCGYVCL
jgi:hypothetical protein